MPASLQTCHYSGGSRGSQADYVPTPVKINQEKDGPQRPLHRFHIYWPSSNKLLDLLLCHYMFWFI